MKIIASHTTPDLALSRLSEHGKLIILDDQPGVYRSIASHPDIFFCQLHDTLVASPDIHNSIKDQFSSNEIAFGQTIPSGKYPSTASYNATSTPGVFVHNLRHTDPVLLNMAGEMQQIHVNQSYTRCNLLGLDNQHFITSDRGIEKKLRMLEKKVLFIDPVQVSLTGHKHGFFGGACGVFQNMIHICGSLKHLKEARDLAAFIGDAGFEYLELYDGPMIDVGSILFVLEMD